MVVSVGPFLSIMVLWFQFLVLFALLLSRCSPNCRDDARFFKSSLFAFSNNVFCKFGICGPLRTLLVTEVGGNGGPFLEWLRAEKSLTLFRRFRKNPNITFAANDDGTQ